MIEQLDLDAAMEHLIQHPKQINDAWSNPAYHPCGKLFAYCSPDGHTDKRPVDCRTVGCLTMVHGGRMPAWTDELTTAIKQDPTLPSCAEDITVDNLPRFVAWQKGLARFFAGDVDAIKNV